LKKCTKIIPPTIISLPATPPAENPFIKLCTMVEISLTPLFDNKKDVIYMTDGTYISNIAVLPLTGITALFSCENFEYGADLFGSSKKLAVVNNT
jgi:hypothetical protein